MAPGFEDSIKEMSSLLKRLDGNETAEASAAAAEEIRNCLATTEGGRGFFVALLTGDSAIADNPPAWLLETLAGQPAVANELLTKNLVMSTMMALTHRRNGHAEMEAGSKRVAERTAQIIERMAQPSLQERLQSMAGAVTAELENPDGEAPPTTDLDRAFLRRWRYDKEQLRLAARALSASI